MSHEFKSEVRFLPLPQPTAAQCCQTVELWLYFSKPEQIILLLALAAAFTSAATSAWPRCFPVLWTFTRPVLLAGLQGLQCNSHPCTELLLNTHPSVSRRSSVRRDAWCHQLKTFLLCLHEVFFLNQVLSFTVFWAQFRREQFSISVLRGLLFLRALASFPGGLACLEEETGQLIQPWRSGQKAGLQEATCCSPCSASEALCQQLGHRRAYTLLETQHISNNYVAV